MFAAKSENIFEMAEFIAQCGIDLVIFYDRTGKTTVFDTVSKKKFSIPKYPAKVIDMVGSYSAFCGGFGAGFTKHFDPLLAGLMGSVSASINEEGSTPFHTLNTFHDLAHARLESIKELVVPL